MRSVVPITVHSSWSLVLFVFAFLILMLPVAARAQTVKALRVIVTKTPQTMATGQEIDLDSQTRRVAPAAGRVFAIAVFLVAPIADANLDHSGTLLTGCGEPILSRTTLLTARSVAILTAPPSIDSRGNSDLGPWGLPNRPPTEDERRYGVGNFATLKAGQERQVRYLFQIPESCVKRAKISFGSESYSLAEHRP